MLKSEIVNILTNKLRTKNHSHLNNIEYEISYPNYSRDNLDQNQRDSAEDIYTSLNDFLSCQKPDNISEGKCKIVDLKSLTSTVVSVGVYKEISACSNPASNPTPSVFYKLTDEQKLIKLFDVMDQINKEGKYLCTEEKKQIRVGKLVNCCKIFNIEKMKNDPIDYCVVFSLNPSFPLYFIKL